MFSLSFFVLYISFNACRQYTFDFCPHKVLIYSAYWCSILHSLLYPWSQWFCALKCFCFVKHSLLFIPVTFIVMFRCLEGKVPAANYTECLPSVFLQSVEFPYGYFTDFCTDISRISIPIFHELKANWRKTFRAVCCRHFPSIWRNNFLQWQVHTLMSNVQILKINRCVFYWHSKHINTCTKHVGNIWHASGSYQTRIKVYKLTFTCKLGTSYKSNKT